MQAGDGELVALREVDLDHLDAGPVERAHDGRRALRRADRSPILEVFEGCEPLGFGGLREYAKST
jgi:hypothetical protein